MSNKKVIEIVKNQDEPKLLTREQAITAFIDNSQKSLEWLDAEKAKDVEVMKFITLFVNWALWTKIKKNTRIDYEFIKESVFNHKRKLETTSWAETDENGQILKKFSNIDNYLNKMFIQPRYNEMKRELELYESGVLVSDTTQDQSKSNKKSRAISKKIAQIRMNAYDIGLQFSDKDWDNRCCELGYANSFHPVREWIDSKPWDGEKRIERVIDSVKLRYEDEQPLKYVLMFKWFVTAVKVIYNPGKVQAEGVLILQGRQGLYKTTWGHWLCPIVGAYEEGVSLGLSGNSSKDDKINFHKHWICELGEMESTFQKSSQEEMKNFITKKVDNIRPPYASKAEPFERQGVFFGTVNGHQFLFEAENRRYWTLGVEEIKIDQTVDIQQFWAEVKHYVERGEQHWLSIEERKLLDQIQQKYRVPEPIIELFHINYSINEDETPVSKLLGKYVYESATQILRYCGKSCSRAEASLLCNYLNARGVHRLPNGKWKIWKNSWK